MSRNPLSVLRAVFAALLIALFAAPALGQNQPMLLPVDPAPLTVATDGGQKSFSIEIADNALERAAGLMFRETMDDMHGMLFVFEDTRPVSFWMKNTPMPLDLVFIGEDGMVRDILPGEPFSEAAIGPGEPVRFVLELKAGMAENAGIAVGDRIRHPAIDAVAGG